MADNTDPDTPTRRELADVAEQLRGVQLELQRARVQRARAELDAYRDRVAGVLADLERSAVLRYGVELQRLELSMRADRAIAPLRDVLIALGNVRALLGS